MRKMAVAAGIFAAALTTAAAQEMTNTQLVLLCGDSRGVGEDICLAYISGVADGALIIAKNGGSSPPFCIPGWVFPAQIKQAVTTALSVNQGETQANAAAIVLTALRDRFPFPCR